jgi:hypothetical protein
MSAQLLSVESVGFGEGKFNMKVKKLRWVSVLLASSVLVLVGYWNEQARTTIRWVLWSGDYKTQMAKEPPAGTYLRHFEWDGWGFAGAGDTTMYLVFDPQDTLSTRALGPASLSGLPCKVYRVRRLETGWYTVLFYTDTDWDSCPLDDSGQLRSATVQPGAH